MNSVICVFSAFNGHCRRSKYHSSPTEESKGNDVSQSRLFIAETGVFIVSIPRPNSLPNVFRYGIAFMAP